LTIATSFPVFDASEHRLLKRCMGNARVDHGRKTFVGIQPLSQGCAMAGEQAAEAGAGFENAFGLIPGRAYFFLSRVA
jgi:hypothetical protein